MKKVFAVLLALMLLAGVTTCTSEEGALANETTVTETVIEQTTERVTEPSTQMITEETTKPSTEPAAEETAEPTTEETEEPTVKPTEDNGQDYVLNRNTKKFHYPWCNSAQKIKESNKSYFHGTREEVISRGYDACRRCNP